MIHFSKVRLKQGQRGSTGTLASYLSGTAQHIGQSHHLMWSLFEEGDTKRDFLYHLTGKGPSETVLIYSARPVSDTHNLWDIDTQEFSLLDTLQAGDRVAWSLRINSAVKIDRKNHDLVVHARKQGEPGSWSEIAERVVPPWVSQRLARVGLQAPLESTVLDNYGKRKFAHSPHASRDTRNEPVTLAVSDLRGVGTVVDPEALRVGVAAGIGSGRAYGCGMLLMRKV